MWCATCGRAAEAGALFCGGCGGRLPAADAPTAAAQEQAPDAAALTALPEPAPGGDTLAPMPPQEQASYAALVDAGPVTAHPQQNGHAGGNGYANLAPPPLLPAAHEAQQQQQQQQQTAAPPYAGPQPQYHYAPPQHGQYQAPPPPQQPPQYQHQHQQQYGQPYGRQGDYAQYPPYAAQQAPPPGPKGSLFEQVGERVSRMTGVGPVEGLDARELFSAVFQKKAEEDVEEYFLVGTYTTTPPLTSVKAVWPKPWVFYKTFLFSVTVFAGFLMCWSFFKNENILPGLWVIGSFVIPLSVVMFYFEMNIAKNVSLYQVMKMVTLGGVLSLIASLIGFQTTSLGDLFGAMAAGPVEETGKLAALLLIVKNRRYPWTLNGLLLGGAVGAGFAGFESAGYALRIMIGGGDTAMMGNMFMRGVLAPGGHVAWTALVGAALWRVKGSEPFHTGMLMDPRFVRVLLFAMGLHVVWNSPLFSSGIFGILKCVLLGVCAWAAVLAFVQDGIKQVQQAQAAAKEADGGAHAAAVDAAASEIAASGRLVLSGPLLAAGYAPQNGGGSGEYPAPTPQQQQAPPPPVSPVG